MIRRLPALAIFCLALAIRIGCNVWVVPRQAKPVGDAADYVTIADQLLAGHGYKAMFADLSMRPTARRPPLFPLLLAACFWIFGEDYLTVRFLLSLMGAATCVVLFQIGQRLFGDRVGLSTGLACAVLPGMWINNTVLMSETLYVLLLVSFVLHADRVYGRAAWRTTLPLGLLAGLLALTRPEGILVWGLLALWCAVVCSPPQRWRTLAATLAVAAAMIAPWVGRNAVRFSALIPNATSMGQVLACANNDQAYYDPEWLGGLSLDPIDANTNPRYRSWLADRAITEADIDARLRADGLRYAWRHAARLPVVVVWRLRRSFDFWSVHRSVAHEAAEGRVATATAAAWLTFFPTLALALIGAVQHARQARRLFWLYALIAFYVLDVAITWGSPRFRSPIEPLLILFACASFESAGVFPSRRAGARGIPGG